MKKLSIGHGFNFRHTKLGLAVRAKFDAMVDDLMQELGAKPSDFYRWAITTRAGLLHVIPRGDWVACRFDDVEAAKGLGLGYFNQYSGKWNHHYDEGAGEQEINEFRKQLERVL